MCIYIYVYIYIHVRISAEGSDAIKISSLLKQREPESSPTYTLNPQTLQLPIPGYHDIGDAGTHTHTNIHTNIHTHKHALFASCHCIVDASMHTLTRTHTRTNTHTHGHTHAHTLTLTRCKHASMHAPNKSILLKPCNH